MASYIEKCKLAIDQLVEEEAESVQMFIDRELQPLTKEQLNRLAFDAVLRDVKKLEAEAGLASRD